ncbi:nucleoside hydrolase [Violaceomyces palustris]|uniref:Nucleoside hydrolase n=1 Tax=Violaceomyces palustris TaxID=1673888 RepID=A0ACD0P891_9BASI|nr:nucleoside hydrolase [Violaceomyces palustris]
MAPHPLIIDTDPGVDDILALLLALASPDEVEVRAITLTFGNTTLDYAHSNVLRLGSVLREHLESPSTPQAVKESFRSFRPDANKILVAAGAKKPIGGRMFTASYFHGRDGLSGLSSLPGDPFPAPEKAPAPLETTEKSAVDVILDILKNEPEGTVKIAALGPLTNIALAFEKDPYTFSRVAGVSIMGGALDVPGNTSPVAEFNFFADPWACKVLFEKAPAHPCFEGKELPFDLLPLDITTLHTVPYSRLVREEGQLEGCGRLEKFVSTFLTHPRMVTNNFADPGKFDPEIHDLFHAHDPLAVAHAIFVPPGKSCEDVRGWRDEVRSFVVEAEGQLTRGFCVVDRRGGKADSGYGKNRAESDPDSNPSLRKEEQEGGGDQGDRIITISPEEQMIRKKQRLTSGNSKTTTKTNGHATSKTSTGVGAVRVVTETPGKEWFADMFLGRLGL